ncbi:MAG: endonuclease/exonuclease/phosphatase family protein [Paracoccus sp. (in: a-proteobacteria)]|nr:endonuclease/exonuclease/phosphatase family protein [Paracoccus sp. (in: a-proteobacteria)]
MRSTLKLIACLALTALIASYAGRLHPLGDSLAVFRPVLALLLLPLALAFGGWWRAGVLAAGIAALAPILWMMRPVALPPGPPDALIGVYQKNLLYRRPDPAALLADMRESGADVIFLQELSDANLPIVAALAESHPHHLICPAHRVGAVAILSAYPMAAQSCREGSGYAMARVAHPSGAFTAIALHLHWPWPHGQPAQLDAIMGDLAPAPAPVIVGGDFNMISWAGAPRRIASATGTRIAAPWHPTYILEPVHYPMPIDHILVPRDWPAAVSRRGLLGSDHYGLLARIAPPGPR